MKENSNFYKLGEVGQSSCGCRWVIWPVNTRQPCVLRLANTIYSARCVSVKEPQRIKSDNFVNYTMSSLTAVPTRNH